MDVTLNPQPDMVKQVFDKPGTIPELAAEPCLFSASPKFAAETGGPITQQVLRSIPYDSTAYLNARSSGLHPVIDVRVQRLMIGMYPAIPGWHCDSVPRKDYTSQPDFALIDPNSFHLTLVLGTHTSGVSLTEFVERDLEFTYDNTKPIWSQLHKQIETSSVETRSVLSGELYMFNSETPHRARPTTDRGWRYFFRLSMYRSPTISDAVPGQQQVYVLSEENGW